MVDLTVDRLMLLPGTYDISASLYDYAIVHPFDFRQRAVRFDVDAGDPPRDLRRRHVARRAVDARRRSGEPAHVEPGPAPGGRRAGRRHRRPVGVDATRPTGRAVRGGRGPDRCADGRWRSCVVDAGPDRRDHGAHRWCRSTRPGATARRRARPRRWPPSAPSGSCYLRAGVAPDPAWLEAALAALEHRARRRRSWPGPGRPDHGRLSPGRPGWPSPGTRCRRPAESCRSGRRRPPDAPRRTVLPGIAWVARRAELDAVGSFDPRLDQPFAGIDLAWRLWLAGREVLVDPALPCPCRPQRLAATASPVGDGGRVGPRSTRCAMIYRNLDDASLAAALPAALELSRGPPGGRRAADVEPATAGVPRLHRAAGALEAERPRPPGRASPARRRDPRRARPGASTPTAADAAFVAAHAVASWRRPADLARVRRPAAGSSWPPPTASRPGWPARPSGPGGWPRSSPSTTRCAWSASPWPS